MKTTLTDAKISGLKSPETGQKELSDSKVPGLRLRIGSSGAKTFILRKRIGTKTKNMTIGRYPALSLSDARKRARTLINDIETTGVPALVPTSRTKTIRALWPAYEKAKADLRSIDTIRSIFDRHILPKLGDRIADTVKRSEVTSFVDGIDKPIMARLVLAQLSSFYTWAMPRLDNLEYNPCRDAGRPPKSKRRTRTLTEAELKTLWQVLESEGFPWRQGVKLLILTGQRRNEVFAADRSEFDLDARTWTIPAERAKNDKTHIVPLSAAAIEIIESVPIIDDSPKLFPAFRNSKNSPSGFSKVTERLRGKVDGLLDRTDSDIWTLHDIRRTVATGFQRLGMRFEVTEATLNHISGSKGGIAGVYQTHDWAEEKCTALNAWAIEVDRIVTGAKFDNVVKLGNSA